MTIMKKIILFLTMLGLFVACNNIVIDENVTKSNENDTISTPIENNDDDKENDNNSEENGNENEENNNEENGKNADSDTEIDSTECYLLQMYNTLGEPIDSYLCMFFEEKVGHTFDEAFESMKTELDALVQRMVENEKEVSMYDAERWELRQVVRNVKNAPNDKLVYTSIELYMFSKIYNAYIILYQYCVIDSEGNIYHMIELLD